MVRFNILFILIFFTTIVYSQFGINPIITNRIHSDEIPFISVRNNISWVHAIGGGLELYHLKSSFSLSFTIDYYFDLDNINPNSLERAEDINLRWNESFLLLNYRFKKSYIGAGIFNQTREASLNLQSNFANRDYSGLVFSFTQSLKWLDIEYKTKVNLKPGFAAILGSNSHSLSFNYRISNYEKERRKSDFGTVEEKYELNINLGGRLFNASSIEVLPLEKGYGWGFKPAMGIELINKNSNWGVFIEKDIWMAFNAGSNYRIIKDQIINNSLGIRYRIPKEGFRDIRLSLGLNFVRDSEVKRELHGKPNNAGSNLNLNQMRGVLIGLNIEFLKNTDIEIRHTIPYSSSNEKIFEPKRFSFGLNYRFEPIK